MNLEGFMHEVGDLGAFMALNFTFFIAMVGKLWWELGGVLSRFWFLKVSSSILNLCLTCSTISWDFVCKNVYQCKLTSPFVVVAISLRAMAPWWL